MRAFVSFDFDRTLADYSKAHGNSILAGIHECFGNKFRVNWFDISHNGLTDVQIIAFLVHNHGISYHTIFEKMDDCIKIISDKFQEYLKIYPVELLDKAEKTLQNLSERDHVTIGLSTGNIKTICLQKTKYTGIDNFFSFGSFGDEVFNRYQLLKLTKSRLKIEYRFSSEDIAFHVGDSVLDMLSAGESGLIPIGITTGKNSERELYDAGAKLVFKKLQDFELSIDSIIDLIQEKYLGSSLYLNENI